MVRMLLGKWVILAVAVWVTAAVVPGIKVVDGGIGTYLFIAFVFATVNVILGSILRLFTLPLILLTLGLFSLVITAFMLLVTDSLMDSFEVDGFGPAFVGALVIAIISSILDLLFLRSRDSSSRGANT